MLWLAGSAVALACGLWALRLGFSIHWDLLNYQLYDPHALVHGRLGGDIAPAQIQTFLNPVLWLPLWTGFRFLPLEWLTFFTGALQGAQWVLIYLVGRLVTDAERTRRTELVIVAALGLAGPVFRFELGTFQGDTLVSGLVLLSLWLLLRQSGRSRPADGGAVMWAGVAGGAACALKLTFGIYAPALAVASWLLAPAGAKWRWTWQLGLGGMLGFLVLGGPWFGWLWAEYGNPLFPYFNDFFESSWAAESSFQDRRFLPGSPGEALLYPLAWTQDHLKVWELDFFDPRVVLLVPLLLLALLGGWRWTDPAGRRLTAVLWFLLTAYILWLWKFGIYRYLAVVEMLAPMCLLAIAMRLVRRRFVAYAATAALCLSQALVHGPRYEGSWAFAPEAATPLRALDPDAMIVMTGYEPLAFIAAWLPDDVEVVRLRSNFMVPGVFEGELYEHARLRARTHDGRAYLVQTRDGLADPVVPGDLAGVGWQPPRNADCQPVFHDATLQRLTHHVLICGPLQRAAGRDQAGW